MSRPARSRPLALMRITAKAMGNRTVAEVFPPGEFIAEEIEARGWSQIELAEILGRTPKLIGQLIAGKCAVTPETARGLGAAFGTGAEFWMNLERDYRLAHAVQVAIVRNASPKKSD
jgi:addiction module HigA family antidote